MPKLYEVEITVRAVIVADDLCDAMHVANCEARDIIRDDSLDDVYVVREIKKIESLPPDWTAACIPYGDHQDESIAQILADQPPVIERDTKTIDMFGVAP